MSYYKELDMLPHFCGPEDEKVLFAVKKSIRQALGRPFIVAFRFWTTEIQGTHG